jgi:hypothetical protein
MLNALGTAGTAMTDLRDLFYANGQKGSFRMQKPTITVRKRVSINRIVVEEGVDVAIWKLMSDRKWRGAKEIVALVKDFGFDPAHVENRAASIVRSNRIYDRRGDGPRTVYRLKAHIPMPIPANAKEEPKQQMTMPEVVEMPTPEPIAVMPVVEQKPVPQKLGAIQPGDTLDAAIWKLMADYCEYSAADLVVLLEEYDYNPVSVSPKMSMFFKKGYVTRREVQQLPKRPFFVYQLNDMPMPEFAGRHAPAANELAAPQVPAVQPHNENKEEEVNGKQYTPIRTLTAVAEVKDEQPMFEVSMKIRGADFTFDEVKALYVELTSNGFAAGAPAKKSLLQATYNIKGVSFTHEELNQLVGKIADCGVEMSKLVGL